MKNLDKLEPIDHGVVASPHTPIYKMHRYFARRPYSVFRYLVEHYSCPGSVVLDPFCGGGVTVVEALRQQRKVIGVDLDPVATFITKMEVADVNIDKLEEAFKHIEKTAKDEVNRLYFTKCPNCKREVSAEWFEWSYIFKCAKCNKEVILSKTKKIGKAVFECPHCKEEIKAFKSERKSEEIVNIKLKCSCGFKGEKTPDDHDFKKIRMIEENFERTVKKKELWYPKDEIPVGEKTREVLNQGIKCFYELFTKRNLLALATIFKEIEKIEVKKIRELMELAFTSRLFESSKLAHIKDSTVVKPGHHYWLATIPAEANVWSQFTNGYEAVLKGKKYSQKEIGNNYKEAKTFEDLKEGKTCLILNQSSTQLPFPEESVDVIITDPPYGGNVQYSELSDFWVIWLKKTLGIETLIDRTEEAIINPYQSKGLREYRELIYQVLKQCHRVLKANRWLVMTFHNRNFDVWNAIHLAAHDAGFILPEKDGMIYQPPIHAYTTTLHQQASGAMLGDFILSFERVEKLPQARMMSEVEIGSRIREIAGQAIRYHGGASLNTIYMRLIPVLLNAGLLHKIPQQDLAPYLEKYFVEKDGRWYFKENIDETGMLKPIEYVPAEARIEYLVRSLLYEKEIALEDDILNAVYSNLINADAPLYEEITRVLSRIAEKVPSKGREGWKLKERGKTSDRQKALTAWVEEIKPPQVTLTGERIYSEESDHDLVIKRLVKIGEKRGLNSHIGETEQKYKEFKEISLPMGDNIQFGLPLDAFSRIKEIDVLWLKSSSIVAAFEVEKSTTIDSGITRFRELFAAIPYHIPAYIVVPDARKEETENKIGSLANRREGLHLRIRYILFSDLMNKDVLDIDEISRKVI